MKTTDYDQVFRSVLDVRSQSGDELVCLCPLHGDTTPSLWANVRKGLWTCYACGEGGSAAGLLKKLGKSSSYLPAPNSQLAEIEAQLEEWAAHQEAKVCSCHAIYQQARQLVYSDRVNLNTRVLTSVNSLGYSFPYLDGMPSKTCITTTGTQSGRCDRCNKPLILPEEFLKRFPPSESLEEFLGSRDVSTPSTYLDGKPSSNTHVRARKSFAGSTAELFELGWDSLNRAVTIPYRDEYGLLLGVVHRRLRGKPKYHYPRKFPRNETMFGSWLLSRDETLVPRLDRNVLPEKWVVLCEGPFDVMKVWQSGIPAVGMWGSQLHDRHVELLSKLGVRGVVLFTDRDAAGRSAALSAAGKLRRASFDVKRVSYPRSYPQSFSDPGSLPNALIRARVRRARWV